MSVAPNWTEEEDQALYDLRKRKIPWAHACCDSRLNNRSQTSCENRWYMLNHANDAKCERRDGEAVAGEFYQFTVPEGDPLLKRLIRVHGNDKVDRTVSIRPSTPCRIYPGRAVMRSAMNDL